MGLMGERMSDYDKLVEILRNYSTEVISYKIDGAFAYAVTAAADAIEQLEADNESYKCAFADLHNEIANYCETIATLEKERDAAVDDIPTACGYCKWFRDCGEVGCFCPKPCTNISGVNTMWEWRGVQEEENGTEV